MRLSVTARDARDAVRRTQELDPNWRPPSGLHETVEGEIRHNEDVAAAARARYNEITRDAIPGTNPSWGVNRLRKELSDQGYVLAKEARGDGLIFENPSTRDMVRIMERPATSYRNDPPQKHFNDYYYRYKPYGGGWGTHITIPNKD